MLLIDDLLMAPARGLMFVLREVAKSAREQRAGEQRTLLAELAELHRALDGGELTEAAFDAREAALLERLDRLRGNDMAGQDAAPHGT
jgi:hypothetical protein